MSLLGVRVLDRPGAGRSLLALFLAQAMATGAITTSISLSSIVATHLTGSARYSGVPTTLTQVAGALGAFTVAQIMARRGRRFGMLAGYAVGAVGAALGCAMALAGSFPGFLVGAAMVGMANAVTLQGRYAGAELVEPDSRGRVVGLILFGAVLGSLISWALTPSVQTLAEAYRLPPVELGWGLSSLLLTIGGLTLTGLFTASPALKTTAAATRVPLRQVVGAAGHPLVRLGVISLVVGQAVMVMLMALVPIHLEHLGHTLPTVTAVITVHVAGMFGFAWLTGLVVDRYGTGFSGAAGAVMLIGGALLAGALTSVLWIGAGLFLIGLGWNYCLVSGSALLSRHLADDIRIRFQGLTDLLVWLAAGTGTLGGGLLVGISGFSAVALVGAGLATTALLAAGAVSVRRSQARAIPVSLTRS